MKRPHTKDGSRAAGYLTIDTYKNGVLQRSSGPLPNRVVSSDGYGRNLIIRQLAGITTYPLEIDSISLGDDATTPADNNTGLLNELVADIPLTAVTVTNNVLEIRAFVTDDNLPDGTYRELGVYCGTRLFARILIGPEYTKAPGEDTLFTYTLTLSA